VEYKAEAYDMFSLLMASIKAEVLNNLFRSTTNLMAFEQFLASLPINLTVPQETPVPPRPVPSPLPGPAVPAREKVAVAQQQVVEDGENDLELVIPLARHDPNKVGRNDPCPCGSGKKYKNCCGRSA